jgi:hypothetical protein
MHVTHAAKQLLRSPAFTALFFLLAAGASVFLCIAAGLWGSAARNNAEISRNFTTIAIPNQTAIREAARSTRYPWPLSEPFRADYELLKDTYLCDSGRADAAAADIYPAIRARLPSHTADERRFLRGYAPGLSVPLSAYEDIANYDGDTPYNRAAFVVTCEAVEDIPAGDPGEWYRPTYKLYYSITFRVEQTLQLNGTYAVPEIITCEYDTFDEQGGRIFEPGKRYFVSGEYVAYGYMRVDIPGTGEHLILPDPDSVPQIQLSPVTYLNPDIIVEIDGETYRKYNSNAESLRLVRAELNEPFEDFIARAENADIAAMLQESDMNVYSTVVLTTGRLGSLLVFNKKETQIMQGRAFTDREYAGGARVCLVSSRFAQANGLEPGSTLRLALYELDVRSYDGWSERPYESGRPLLAEETFEVIGVYSDVPYRDPHTDPYYFPPNTVIIPAAALEGVDFPDKGEAFIEDYTARLAGFGVTLSEEALELQRAYFRVLADYDLKNPQLYGFIIPNGQIAAFEQDMEEAGLGGFFLYYDQGYIHVAPLVEGVARNARTLLLVAVMAWAAVFSLYFLVNALRQRKGAGVALTLGTPRKAVFAQLFSGFALLLVPALLAGALAGALLLRGVTERAYAGAEESSIDTEQLEEIGYADETEFTGPFEPLVSAAAVPAAAAAQLAAALIAAAAVCLLTSRGSPAALLKN